MYQKQNLVSIVKQKKNRNKSNCKAKLSAAKESPKPKAVVGKVGGKVAAETKKTKLKPHSESKKSGIKAGDKITKKNGTNKQGSLEQGSRTDGTLAPSEVKTRIHRKDAEDELVVNASETSGKRKRNRKNKSINTTSGSSSLLPDEKDENLAKKRLLYKDVNMDNLFDNINEKFKQKLTSKISKLKAKLHIREGNFTAAGTDDEDEGEGEGGSLAFKKHAHRPELDEPLNEVTNGMSSTDDRPAMAASLVDLPDGRNAIFCATKMQTGDDIDPNKFMAIKPKHLKTQLPDTDVMGDEALDDDDDETVRQMAITEAFAGDDVVADFLKEKEEFEESLKPEPVALALPGWGSWEDEVKKKPIGADRRKKRRYGLKSKDSKVNRKRSMVMVKDKISITLHKHMVDSVPFPFKSVADFEASIRAPIGNIWIPQSAHQKLCAPRVTTRMGMIIEPMNENSLMKKMALPIKNSPKQTKGKR